MSKFLLSFMSFAVIGTAHATSLHPCTPTVKALPTRISCVTDSRAYSIVVDTLMSPQLEMCRGKNHIEYKTASVEVADKAGKPLGRIEIFGDSFSYTLSPDGSATFESDAFSLQLQKCVTPLQGGFSVGN